MTKQSFNDKTKLLWPSKAFVRGQSKLWWPSKLLRPSTLTSRRGSKHLPNDQASFYDQASYNKQGSQTIKFFMLFTHRALDSNFDIVCSRRIYSTSPRALELLIFEVFSTNKIRTAELGFLWELWPNSLMKVGCIHRISMRPGPNWRK